MFVQQTQYTIEKIVSRIRSGRLALPDFQRDFVWSPAQVADLLESISREWPIGSLLLLNGPQPFAFRPIDAAPEVLHPELDLYVLDGQQRVTAIYHAIQNVSQYVYYVDFSAVDEESEEVISWERRTRFERQFGKSLAERASHSIALVSDFWDNTQFHDWLDLLPHRSKRNEFVAFRERRLSGLQSKVYQLLAIELEQGIELEALAKIFETLNKTGVRLNAFDLLVAKLYPIQFNLRDQWEAAKSENDLLARFDPDGLEIIKLVALLVRRAEGRKHARGVRQGDVLALEPGLVAKYWQDAVSLYTDTLKEIGQFGVTSSSMVPSWSMILGAAACLISPSPSMLSPWWMSRLREQTFAQAANTRIVAEFDSIVRGEYGLDDKPDAAYEDLLALPARPNGLLLRGIMGLAINRGALDPLTGKHLTHANDPDWAELGKDGSVTKISASTTFGNLVFTTRSGARSGRLIGDVRKQLFGIEALESQGIDPETLLRKNSFLDGLFR